MGGAVSGLNVDPKTTLRGGGCTLLRAKLLPVKSPTPGPLGIRWVGHNSSALCPSAVVC